MSGTPDRGIDYADGGVAGLDVHYPDPERIAAIHAEWLRADNERLRARIRELDQALSDAEWRLANPDT